MGIDSHLCWVTWLLRVMWQYIPNTWAMHSLLLSFYSQSIIMPFIYLFISSPFIYSYASDLIGDHNHCKSHQTVFLLFYAFLFIFHQTLYLTLSYLLSLYITHTKEVLLSHWLWIKHRPPTILSIIFLLDIAMLSSINRVAHPVLYLSLDLVYIWA